ncbi:MAG TPA: ComEA family DNA-binding protein [Candidatus Nitrosotalea sp.]|nr:ComEA family DNA-binding protein [Candidatus Nitrosotalea sp.]
MLPKFAFGAAVVGLAALALWHPARAPLAQSAVVSATASLAASPSPIEEPGARADRRGARSQIAGDDLVVYVAGAVKRPGLYHLKTGERDARAVELAGGFSGSADAGAVNLAQRASDGDEVYVPVAGETGRRVPGERRTRRHHSAPPSGSVDVNRAGAEELAAVPGIGRAIAARIVELREREGGFGSLDQLLDVAGMTQSRLERARSYLRQP